MGLGPLFVFRGAFTPRSHNSERIREAAARVAASHGLEIFDIQLRRESIGTVLRVIIDRQIRAGSRSLKRRSGSKSASG